jgi:hypothetical protein
MKIPTGLALSFVAIGLASSADAQMSAPPIVSALPDVRSMSSANAAGVLHYCVEQRLVSSSAADPVLAPLASRSEITASTDYSQGAQGHILAAGKDFSLGPAPAYLRSQACDLVFRHARKLQ